MGYYINPPDHRSHGKGEWLIENHDAIEVSTKEALQILESQDTNTGVICVVDNGSFEAAAFCFDKREFEEFSFSGDNRPKRWFSIDREKAKQLSGYNR